MPKVRDLTGQRFGRLVVRQRAEDRFYGGKRYVAWDCDCDCGKHKVIISTNLKNGQVKSCGCLQSEIVKQFVSPNKRNLLQFFEGTEITAIKSNVIRKNNKSGTNGVSWDRGYWRAEIWIQSTHYTLGRYKKLDDAIKARKLAEEKYFTPLIEKYKKETGA